MTGGAMSSESESIGMEGKARLFVGSFSRFGIYIAFAVICAFFAAFNPLFLTAGNLVNIIRQVSFNAIIAMGMTFVIIASGIDLSVGSVLALTAVIAASLVTEEAQLLPVPLAVLAGLGIGAACGLFNGFVITRGRLAPFIVTLVTMTMARGASQLYTKGRPITGLRPGFDFMGAGSWLGIPIPIFILAFVVVMSYFILSWTKMGRYIYAVGGNERAALASGIKVHRVKIFVYVYSGMTAALVGLMLSARLNSASPILGVGYELDAIAATVIGGASMDGGKGKVIGTLIGALIIGTISNGLDILNISAYYQQIIKGIIILVAVLLDKRD